MIDSAGEESLARGKIVLDPRSLSWARRKSASYRQALVIFHAREEVAETV